MAKLISASIDLTKIDKSKIVEKDGKKWYNITIALNDEKDTYGNNVAISQGQTKDESAAKVKKVYLGNGKVVWEKEPVKETTQSHTSANFVEPEPVLPTNEEDLNSLPF